MKKLMDGVYSLGFFHPEINLATMHYTQLDSFDTDCELKTRLEKLVKEKGFKPSSAQSSYRFTCRSPIENKNVFDYPTTLDWHRDGGGAVKMGMIVWSNESPTKVRVGEEILQPQPFEVILIDNEIVEHRVPEKLGENRWFFRAYVEMPNEVS